MESDDRMDGSPVLIGLLIFLVCCSAFFSASETALTSLSKIRLRNMVEENVKNADLIMRLLEDPNRLLSSILVGNNLVNNGASALTTTLAIQIFRGNSGGAGIATIVITVIILIFGEITPKTIAAQKAEKVALAVVKIISICVMGTSACATSISRSAWPIWRFCRLRPSCVGNTPFSRRHSTLRSEISPCSRPL